MLCEGGLYLCRGKAGPRFRGYDKCVWLSALCPEYLIFRKMVCALAATAEPQVLVVRFDQMARLAFGVDPDGGIVFAIGVGLGRIGRAESFETNLTDEGEFVVKVGFIAWGHMGNGIVSNLLKAGLQVTVFNLAPAVLATIEL
jgi:hypothetical protein